MASIIDPSNPPIAEDERALVAYYLAEISRSTHFAKIPSLSKNAELALDDIASSLGHLIMNLVEEQESLA